MQKAVAVNTIAAAILKIDFDVSVSVIVVLLCMIGYIGFDVVVVLGACGRYG